jgi:hypothetical protein
MPRPTVAVLDARIALRGIAATVRLGGTPITNV